MGDGHIRRSESPMPNVTALLEQRHTKVFVVLPIGGSGPDYTEFERESEIKGIPSFAMLQGTPAGA
jgi:hypothetical protein